MSSGVHVATNILNKLRCACERYPGDSRSRLGVVAGFRTRDDAHRWHDDTADDSPDRPTDASFVFARSRLAVEVASFSITTRRPWLWPEGQEAAIAFK